MDAQASGPVSLESPSGDSVTFQSMGGIEGVSRLFVYEIDVVSTKADIKPIDWVGQRVTVHLERSESAEDARQWNGIVAAFQYVGAGDDELSLYRITLRPWLWYLTKAADCRIFQNMTVPDIIAKVFRGRGFTDFEHDLQESYPQREYVVQYRETDFNFVSRLMERDGIYYFFRHANGKHTLVLADSPQTPQPAAGAEQLPYAPRDAHRDETLEYVTRWRLQEDVQTSRVALADFDFTRPRLELYTLRDTSDTGEAPALEAYDYPGGFSSLSEGDAYAQLDLDQERMETRELSGETNARAFAVGATFELADHPREDQNAKYLVASARYRLVGRDVRSAGAPEAPPFACSFRAIPAQTTFRAPRRARKALVRGLQTARVVGPAGQEMWTDQYGRVKVQFPWDRLGRFDENSSCFVRVSQAWAGSGWGAQFIPRIGQEVIVDFLEGDPDRPIVVGSVYNGANAPPFKLPDNQTQSGVRTRSTPNGTSVNHNEIRFEDALGNEELYIQAEKTQTTLVKGSQSVAIGKNRALRVDGSESIAVGTTRSVQVLGASYSSIGADRADTIGGAARLDVGAAHVTNVSGSQAVHVIGTSLTHVGGVMRLELGDALRVTAAGDESRTIGGTRDIRVSAKATHSYAAETKTVVGHPDREASQSTYVYGQSSAAVSKELTIQSDTSIVLQCGSTRVELTPDGVKINGKTIALSGSSSVGITTANGSLAVDDDVTAIGKQVTISSSGAQLALQSGAKLTGSQVQLGAGSGASASSSAQDAKDDKKKKPVFIRTRLLRNGTAVAGVAYKLVLDGGQELGGSTTGDGLVEQQVPGTVASAELTLLDTGETMSLTIGVIEPETTLLGAQHRLLRLGFYHGAFDGQPGPLTTHALAMFQKSHGLAVTGELDGATQAALKSSYGS